MYDCTMPAEGLGLHDRIAHDLMPGHVMAILEVRPCDTDDVRQPDHSEYRVVDPGGNSDWLCAFDVHPIR
jgi:hypothetical protein